MIQPLPSQTPKVLKELTCPNCGGPLPQHLPGTQTLICSRCNSYVIQDAAALHIAGKGGKLPAPPAPIKLGQRFVLEATGYFVLGRVLYEGWDDEDRWQWTEWLLGSDDGRLLWLSYDKEDGFVLFRKMRIREAFDPDNDSSIPTSDGKRAAVRERYPAKIVGAEGELTFQAKAGDRLTMVEGAGFGKQYSVQLTLAELEVYEGTPLQNAAVAAALNDPAWGKQLAQQTQAAKINQTIGVMALVFAVIGVVLALVANGTGELLISQEITLNAAAPAASIPINFAQSDRPALVRLWLTSAIALNSYAEVEVSVISPDESETFIFEKEFWYETGIDEGERWTERDDYGTEIFVPHQTGEHDVEVMLGENNVTDNVVVTVGVYQNHILPLFFLIYALVAGLIGGVFLFLGLRR